jgi:hypothetical protein
MKRYFTLQNKISSTEVAHFPELYYLTFLLESLSDIPITHVRAFTMFLLRILK